MRWNTLLFVMVLLASSGCGDDTMRVSTDAGTSDARPSDWDGGGGCSGCITSAGTCVAGATAASCGAGGSACVTCGAGEDCADGECRMPPSCDSTNCGGCCDGDTCVAAPDDASCGAGGGECTSCTAPATCEGGVCVNPCDAMSCGGCCGPSGCVEIEDESVARCGRTGAACGACGGGEACVDGACVDTSCSATCAGCCIGATCIDPVSVSSCGADGSPCMGCGADAICTSGMCMPDLSTTWDVIAVSGVVPERTPDGDPWDSFGGLPDPIVRLTVGAAGAERTGMTTSQPNTTSPAWNEPVLQRVTAQQIIDGATLTVLDEDLVGGETIGTCTLAYAPSDFPSVRHWVCSADATGPAYAGWEVVLRVERAP